MKTYVSSCATCSCPVYVSTCGWVAFDCIVSLQLIRTCAKPWPYRRHSGRRDVRKLIVFRDTRSGDARLRDAVSATISLSKHRQAYIDHSPGTRYRIVLIICDLFPLRNSIWPIATRPFCNLKVPTHPSSEPAGAGAIIHDRIRIAINHFFLVLAQKGALRSTFWLAASMPCELAEDRTYLLRYIHYLAIGHILT